MMPRERGSCGPPISIDQHGIWHLVFWGHSEAYAKLDGHVIGRNETHGFLALSICVCGCLRWM